MRAFNESISTLGHPAEAEGRGVHPTEEGAPGPLSGRGQEVPRNQALHTVPSFPTFPGGLSKQRGGEVRPPGSTRSPKVRGLQAGREGRGTHKAGKWQYSFWWGLGLV